MEIEQLGFDFAEEDNSYKVVRTDGHNENVVRSNLTKEDANKYKSKCDKYNSKKIYSYEIRK